MLNRTCEQLTSRHDPPIINPTSLLWRTPEASLRPGMVSDEGSSEVQKGA
jgi:hypothetical protein